MRKLVAGALLLALSSGPTAAAAQQPPVPRPFPTPDAAPGEPGTQAGQPDGAALATPETDLEAPTEALGVPLYPSAQYLASYDAGRGQHFHLFGTTAGFAEMVRYYSVMLDDRGRRVYDAPPIHQFETARFRDERMDYRPSVTIKDYTWNGSNGYVNTTRSGDPATFPTIIQITTPPPGETDR